MAKRVGGETFLEWKWAAEREEAAQRLREAQKACKSPNPLNPDKAFWSAMCEHGDWNMRSWSDGVCPQCGAPALCAILDPAREVTILSDEGSGDE